MPVYNEEKHLDGAIQSILGQTYKEFLLIISDNASTDGTSDICRNYSEKDGRIIYIRQEVNVGAIRNFKHVLDLAETPYLMWCGGHDLWHEEFIECLLPVLESDEQTVLVYPRTQNINLDGSDGKVYSNDPGDVLMEKPASRYIHVLDNAGAHNLFHGIWRTNVLRACPYLPVYAPDTLILVNAALHGYIRQVDRVLFYRRSVRVEKDRMFRALADVTGARMQKQASAFLLRLSMLKEHLRIIFGYGGNMDWIQRIKLAAMTTLRLASRNMFGALVTDILKSVMPVAHYDKLRHRWKRIGRK